MIDLEMTGLDPTTDEIISFATVTVQRGRVQLDDARYELVRPQRMPDWDTIRIHGLREVDLAEAPQLEESLDPLLETLAGRALVAHVASIETRFPEGGPAATRSRPPEPGDRYGRPRDRAQPAAKRATALKSRRARPGIGVSTPGLGDLARWLGLPVHRPHEADGDALTTAQVFIALATHLESFRTADARLARATFAAREEQTSIAQSFTPPFRLQPWKNLRRTVQPPQFPEIRLD